MLYHSFVCLAREVQECKVPPFPRYFVLFLTLVSPKLANVYTLRSSNNHESRWHKRTIKLESTSETSSSLMSFSIGLVSMSIDCCEKCPILCISTEKLGNVTSMTLTVSTLFLVVSWRTTRPGLSTVLYTSFWMTELVKTSQDLYTEKEVWWPISLKQKSRIWQNMTFRWQIQQLALTVTLDSTWNMTAMDSMLFAPLLSVAVALLVSLHLHMNKLNLQNLGRDLNKWCIWSCPSERLIPNYPLMEYGIYTCR